MTEYVTELIGEGEISRRVGLLAGEISHDYAGEKIYLVGLLKGAVILMADLARKISIESEFDFMDVSSYSGADSTGNIKIVKDLSVSVTGKNVLLVEDIIDTGRTLYAVIERLKLQNPSSLKVCCLLNKPGRREIGGVKVDYVGFEIPDEFVVGYGLDYEQRYRNLPYIGVLKFKQQGER